MKRSIDRKRATRGARKPPAKRRPARRRAATRTGAARRAGAATRTGAAKRSGGARRTRAAGRPARERILDAAAWIYALHGYRGASLSAIARRARVTKPLILYHFSSKKRLFASLAQVAITECERVDDEINAPGLSAPERLRRFVEQYAELARLSPAIFAFAYDVFARPSHVSPELDFKKKGREIFHRLAQMVATGQARAELRSFDPAVVVSAPIAILYMQALAVVSGALAQIGERAHEEIYGLLMRGLEVPNE